MRLIKCWPPVPTWVYSFSDVFKIEQFTQISPHLVIMFFSRELLAVVEDVQHLTSDTFILCNDACMELKIPFMIKSCSAIGANGIPVNLVNSDVCLFFAFWQLHTHTHTPIFTTYISVEGCTAIKTVRSLWVTRSHVQCYSKSWYYIMSYRFE